MTSPFASKFMTGLAKPGTQQPQTQKAGPVKITAAAPSPFRLELAPPAPKWAKGLKQPPGPYKKDAQGRYIYDINGFKIPQDQ